MNSTPPAVTIEPPKFSVPVGGTPRRRSSGYSPSGICQAISPRFRSIDVSVPQGGLTAGKPSGSGNRLYPVETKPWGEPVGAFCIVRIQGISLALTYNFPVVGSKEAPLQLAPPWNPGKTIV